MIWLDLVELCTFLEKGDLNKIKTYYYNHSHYDNSTQQESATQGFIEFTPF